MGTLRDVFAVDLSLGFISEFLKGLEISPSSQIFIMERSGLLVASSTSESPFLLKNKESEPQRLEAIASEDKIIYTTAAYLTQKFSKLTEIQGLQQIDFSIDEERHFGQIVPYKDKRGLDWLIVIVVPEADLWSKSMPTTVLPFFYAPPLYSYP